MGLGLCRNAPSLISIDFRNGEQRPSNHGAWKGLFGCSSLCLGMVKVPGFAGSEGQEFRRPLCALEILKARSKVMNETRPLVDEPGVHLNEVGTGLKFLKAVFCIHDAPNTNEAWFGS